MLGVQLGSKYKEIIMWKKIFFTIVVLIVGLVSFVMYATSGMTDVATEFFIHVKTKHYDDAYNMLSKDFQDSTTQNKFKSFILQSGLTNFKSVDWDERSFESDMGKLEGVVTTKDGNTIPITLNFIKVSEDEWKIYSIYKKSAGLTNIKPTGILNDSSSLNGKSTTIPSNNQLSILVQENMLLFAKGINNKDMKIFYDNISIVWQKDTNVNSLNRAFKLFMDQNADFSILKNYTPIFDKKPTISNENILLIEGHYATSPSVVNFKNSFILENQVWKLIGYNLIVE